MVPNFLLGLNWAKNYKYGTVLFDVRLLIVQKVEGNYSSHLGYFEKINSRRLSRTWISFYCLLKLTLIIPFYWNVESLQV